MRTSGCIAAGCLLASACFSPRYDSGRVLCSAPDEVCPEGLRCIGGRCWSGDDGPDLSVALAVDGGVDLATEDLASACGAVGRCACDPAGGTYLVDPVGGDDSRASGSGTAGGAPDATCAFKTLTAAVSAVGLPTSATTISILGPATLANEQLPIILPAHVTISGTQSGTPLQPDVVILAPPANNVFKLMRNSVGLSSLIIDGGGTAASPAITMVGGTATVQELTIKRMGDTGINATGGVLTIAHGLVVTGTKFTSGVSAALDILGNATVSMSGTTAHPTVISNNQAVGIIVSQSASLSITGVPNGRTGDGTVVFKNNRFGLYIAQAPVPTPPPVVVDGIVAFGSAPGPGIDALAGSNLKVRNCVLVANTSAGIYVETWRGQLPPDTYDDISLLDFGRPGDPGRNVLQDSAGGNPNAGGGLCVNVNKTDAMDAGVQQVLSAEGNIFAEGDCATALLTLTSTAGPNGIGCSSTVDIEVGYLNKVDVTGCTCSSCQ